MWGVGSCAPTHGDNVAPDCANLAPHFTSDIVSAQFILASPVILDTWSTRVP